MKPYRLVLVETHPIQYKAPLFRLLAARPEIDLTVFYAMIPDAVQQGAGFGVSFEWDVPLMEGYPCEVLENKAKHPAVNRFGGCDTPGLFARLKEIRPDAVLVNGWGSKTCLQALWACKRLGIPCWVRGEANLLRKRAAWKHVLHELLLRQYDAFLSIGSANHAFYRFHHCAENRIFFAPYAVDNDYFSAQASARANRKSSLREGFGIPPDSTVFLFAGKLVSKKNPLDLLAAVARLPSDLRARAHVFMVGDGPLRGDCERIAREKNLPVTMAGFLNQSRLPDAYAAADVLVLSSNAGETWGLVVNEAMASSRPALVSRAAGCCADLVREGVTGHSFALHDVPELSALLTGYLRDSARAARQGEAALQRIQRFSYATIVEGILSALQSHSSSGGPSRGGTPC